MRILLASNASYVPPRGGSTRSNLAWLRHLVSKGHVCRVVCPFTEDDVIEQDGISVHRVKDLALRSHVLAEEIQSFQPDWVLVSSEDVSQVLVRVAAEAAGAGRLVYVAHTPQFFPFGPESWNPVAQATEVIRKAAAVVAIGHHMAAYIEQHLGRTAHVIHPPIYGQPPYTRFDSFHSGTVLMINPCVVKGISIFLALAGRLPQYTFLALTGWGTTSADREALARLPNVRILQSVPDIEEVLAQASLLLMPSLWVEGFGLIAMEAMLRGLPVVSSDSGGLKEAKAGTGGIIPVLPVERYEAVFDENHLPLPVIPPQDIEPWVDTVTRLLTDRELYQTEARRSRERALQFVSGLRVEAFEAMLSSLKRPMRILLAHNSLYYPSHGGGDRSNRLLMEALAANGHQVRVVARMERFGEEGHQKLLADLASRRVPAEETAGAVRMQLHGVDVHTLTRDPHLRNYFSGQMRDFAPDIIVTSTDDPAQLLFDLAIQAGDARVVHLVRATIAVPFGPDSSAPSIPRTAMLRHADAVVGVSEYVARYVRQWGRIDAVHVPISLMEPGGFPDVGGFDNPYVTLVNPCAVKGISIFMALAKRMPGLRFAAVPTWGTTAEDLAALREVSNITVLPPTDRIDEILRQTRVLLAPSLWAEARSRIVVEAMAHGVPVIASNTGGIPEAKLGVDYVLPVRPIVRYQGVDENMVPVPEVPEQDIGPWEAALAKVTTDRGHYEELAAASRRNALDYIHGLSVGPFETLLQGLLRTPKRIAAASVQALSPEKRKLLAIRLRQRARSDVNPWFPNLEKAGARVRLFCFPHAGGGTAAYSSWKQAGNAQVAVCPVRLPAREARLAEPAIDDMEELIAALHREIAPYLDVPFVFFGHSMGAAIAFELTRRLRREGKPLPMALFVSSARPPQYRLHHRPQPEPEEGEFLQQLRKVEGIPEEVLANPALMRLALPALRSDTRLYRNYVYTVEPPLPLPIYAYGGRADSQVPEQELAPWREQTTAAFTLRTFPGGHFFLQTAEEEFLARLFRDIADVTG